MSLYPRTGLTRRGFTTGLAGLGLTATSAIPLAAAEAKSLGALAAEKGILFGASFAVHELDRPYGARYAEIYERDARILTSELEFKMSSLRPAADKLDFTGADRLVDYATRRQMQVRGHTLIWNDDLPDWIKRLTANEVEQLLETHLMTILERYRDRVGIWDVVNEPIGPWDRQPGNLRAGPFLSALGEDYISRAFTLARGFAPNATLVLNEAQTETDDQNGATFRSSVIALLKRLKDKGAPIDAVGLQGHLKFTASYDYAAITGFVSDIAALGFAVHITELDVNDTGAPGPISARDAAVADLYERYLTAVLQVPAVKIVQLWQLADPASWMRDPVTATKLGIRAKARPLIYDDAFRRKPAWDAIARAFEAARAR
jgi:endo-1,4-beta-xylanase